MTFKPLLAGKTKLHLERDWPVLVSPKIDGIRCIWRDGKAISRSLKPIPNIHVQRILSKILDPYGKTLTLDGELCFPGDDFSKVASGIMSVNGREDFTFNVFDSLVDSDFDTPFHERFSRIQDVFLENPRILPVPHSEAKCPSDLMHWHRVYLADGYEGSMVRDPEGRYKPGRSTAKEGILLKIKEWADEEAIITGFENLMHNENLAKLNALGHTERSTAMGGKVARDTLGALNLVFADGAKFSCGTGFSEELRQQIWNNRENLKGCTVTIKYQPEPGGRQLKQAPRFPVFIGFRDERAVTCTTDR